MLSLCGAVVSAVAKRGLGYRHRQLRNCAIMGMTAGLAAFFGVALGGDDLDPDPDLRWKETPKNT